MAMYACGLAVISMEFGWCTLNQIKKKKTMVVVSSVEPRVSGFLVRSLGLSPLLLIICQVLKLFLCYLLLQLLMKIMEHSHNLVECTVVKICCRH